MSIRDEIMSPRYVSQRTAISVTLEDPFSQQVVGTRRFQCALVTASPASISVEWLFSVTLLHGCIPDDVPQTEQCCLEYMKPVQEHQCAPYVWATDADVNTIATIVLKRCGLPPVDQLQPRWGWVHAA